jgi:uncharacterized protein (UPF0297 family)
MIERVAEGEQMDIDYKAQATDSEFEPVRVISSLNINGVEIELGENINREQSFYVECNRGGEILFSMRTENYPEAIKTYTEQITAQVYEMDFDRTYKAVTQVVEYVKLTDEHCMPDSKNANFKGKLIVVDANSLLPEYRNSTSQLVECTHGNGANPDAIGTSVFGTELFSDKAVVYGRHQILGLADEQRLPQWAKMKLEMRRDPTIFKFCGYHFKPYRQFEKCDGDFNAQMRRISSERNMGIANYEWGKMDYSHAKFYEIAKSDADIFTCLENGKLYVPCENELFRYNEPPQKVRAVGVHKPDMLAKINNNKHRVKQDKAESDYTPMKTKKTGQEV